MYNQRMKQITCDICNQQFEPTPQAEQTADGELQYFICPHCLSRYDYALVTPRGLELRAELQQLAASLKASKDTRIKARYNLTLQAYQAEVTKPSID